MLPVIIFDKLCESNMQYDGTSTALIKNFLSVIPTVIEKFKKKRKLPCNRPWRRIGL
jgi:hypothetical protein